MSCIAPSRVAARLLIVFVCALVCEGKLIEEHAHEGNEEDYDGELQRVQSFIEFPALDEMTSSERADNRKRARKVATIVEQSVHMLANDLLQMWAITRPEKVDDEDIDVKEDGEPEDADEAKGVGGEENEISEAGPSDGEKEKTADETEPDTVKETGGLKHQEEVAGKPEEEGSMSTEGLGAQTTVGVEAENTEEMVLESTKGRATESAEQAGAKTTELMEDKKTEEESGETSEGTEPRSTQVVEEESTEGVKSAEGAEDEVTGEKALKPSKGAKAETTEGPSDKATDRTDVKESEGPETKTTIWGNTDILNDTENSSGTPEDVQNRDISQSMSVDTLEKQQTVSQNRLGKHPRRKYVITTGMDELTG